MNVVETYHQMARMGPRRSGRTVGNVLSAANVAGRHGRATIVVALDGMIQQVEADVKQFVGRGKVGSSIDVTSLNRVRGFAGPFMLDHYAVDKVVSTLEKEISYLRTRVQQIEARFL